MAGPRISRAAKAVARRRLGSLKEQRAHQKTAAIYSFALDIFSTWLQAEGISMPPMKVTWIQFSAPMPRSCGKKSRASKTWQTCSQPWSLAKVACATTSEDLCACTVPGKNQNSSSSAHPCFNDGARLWQVLRSNVAGWRNRLFFCWLPTVC